MALDELGDSKNLSSRDKYIGVYIGILAVILAICSMGGGNAAKDATLKNIQASNTWAFFQAKNARRQALRLQSDDLEMRLAVEPDLSEDVRQKISARIADYKAQDAKLTSDKEHMEGLDELWEKGKSLEKDRDIALKRDPISTMAKRCCRSRSCWRRSQSSQGVISCWWSVWRSEHSGLSPPSADSRWPFQCPSRLAAPQF